MWPPAELVARPCCKKDTVHTNSIKSVTTSGTMVFSAVALALRRHRRASSAGAASLAA
jgi:hypothetical protein